MSGRLRALILNAVAFFGSSAAECDLRSLGEILDKPGQIVVTNAGDQVAVVAIIADDVKSYPTLAGGATSSAETTVGGRYQVRAVMTPENAQRYRDDLLSLIQIVSKLVDGSLMTEEKTRLFSQLAGINAAIAALEQPTRRAAVAASTSTGTRPKRSTPRSAGSPRAAPVSGMPPTGRTDQSPGGVPSEGDRRRRAAGGPRGRRSHRPCEVPWLAGSAARGRGCRRLLVRMARPTSTLTTGLQPGCPREDSNLRPTV